MPSTAASTQDNRTNSAFREMGQRLSAVESNQLQMMGKQDTANQQFTSLCVDVKMLNGRIDNHEVRIALEERAWVEQIKPAIERLSALELSVARSALFGAAGGGGIVIIIAAALKAFGVL